MFWWRIRTFFPSVLILIVCILFYHLPSVFLLCSVTAPTLSQHVSALFLLFMVDHYATFAAGNALLTACIRNDMYVSSMNQRLLTCCQSDFWSKVHVKMQKKLILIKITEPAAVNGRFRSFHPAISCLIYADHAVNTRPQREYFPFGICKQGDSAIHPLTLIN